MKNNRCTTKLTPYSNDKTNKKDMRYRLGFNEYRLSFSYIYDFKRRVYFIATKYMFITLFIDHHLKDNGIYKSMPFCYGNQHQFPIILFAY